MTRLPRLHLYRLGVWFYYIVAENNPITLLNQTYPYVGTLLITSPMPITAKCGNTGSYLAVDWNERLMPS
ncbi:MAG TPA: hypothetical protein H9845_07340 [Candidatus Agathobaculum pullicola]|nr:hypothetical protein [Candidatus Agathobaculum pullicola]